MTRWIEERCDNCGNQKEMYYAPWCSLCEMPQPKTITTLNLLQCFRFIDRNFFGCLDDNVRLSAREEVWQVISEWSGFSNDSTVYLPLVEALDPVENSLGDLSDEAIKYIQVLVNTFDLDTREVQWEVSW